MNTRMIAALLCGWALVMSACSGGPFEGAYNPTVCVEWDADGECTRSEVYDCNAAADEVGEVFAQPYTDQDYDDFGACHPEIIPECGRELGCDCADTETRMSPAWFEEQFNCDGLDNDCDGEIDEWATDAAGFPCDADYR